MGNEQTKMNNEKKERPTKQSSDEIIQKSTEKLVSNTLWIIVIALLEVVVEALKFAKTVKEAKRSRSQQSDNKPKDCERSTQTDIW